MDIGPDHFLPDVACEDCGEEWGAPWFSFSAVNPPWIGDFPFLEHGDHPVVPWQHFLRIRQRLKRWDPEAPSLIPGASIGCLSGTSSRREFPEFYWDGDDVVLSANCIRHLSKRGVREPFAPASISYRGQPIKDRFSIQPRIIGALAPNQRRELVEKECRTCGFVKLKSSLPIDLTSTHWLLRRAALRTAPHFFVVRETGHMVFTERFLHLLEDLKLLENLQILHCGDFV